MRSVRLALVPLLLVACQDDGSGGGGGDGGGGSHDSPPIDDTPILERTPRLEAECAVQHDLTVLGSNWGGSSLARASAGYRVARLEGIPTAALRISALELDPAPHVGADLYSLSSPDSSAFVASTSLVPAGDGFAAAWVDGTTSPVVRFVRVDGSGSVVAGPTVVTSASGQSGASYPAVRLLASGDGFGLLFASVRYPVNELTFVALDANGAPRGEPVVVGHATWPGAFLAVGDGYAVAWSEESEAGAEVRFARLDAAGAISGTSTRLSPTAGDGHNYRYPAMAQTGDGFLVAWTDAWYSGFDQGSEAVQVARVGGTGEPLAIARLEDAVIDASETRPALVARDDDVVLLWSKGTIIYQCGGCYPDHDLQALIVDPADLVPLSHVLTVSGDAGLFVSGIERDGSRLVLTNDMVWHVSSDTTATVLDCAPN